MENYSCTENKFEIREKLSLKSYIYLINEYIELTPKENMLNDKKNDQVFKFNKIKAAIDVLKENSIKIPEELNSIYLNLCNELSFSYDYLKLKKEISEIVSIYNLRYLIGDISSKEKLSLEDISILIGCLPNTLDNLVHTTYGISKSDLKKFTDYYRIKHFDYWDGRYVY